MGLANGGDHFEKVWKMCFLDVGLLFVCLVDCHSNVEQEADLSYLLVSHFDEDERTRIMNGDGSFSVEKMNRYLSLFTDWLIGEDTVGLYNLSGLDLDLGVFIFPSYVLYSMDRVKIENLEYDDSSMRVEFMLRAQEEYAFLDGAFAGCDYGLVAHLLKNEDGLFKVVKMKVE